MSVFTLGSVTMDRKMFKWILRHNWWPLYHFSLWFSSAVLLLLFLRFACYFCGGVAMYYWWPVIKIFFIAGLVGFSVAPIPRRWERR